MSSVLQDWVSTMPIKMQSVCMTSVRGPDNFRYPSVKVANRWIRSQLFLDADPSNPFIVKPGDPSILDQIFLDNLQEEMEYTSVHYFTHVMHAFQIIGYHHPQEGTRAMASFVYGEFCIWLHVNPETQSAMDYRLRTPEH